MMQVKHETFNQSLLVPIETELYSKSYVFVEGEINQESSKEFVKQMMYLSICPEVDSVKLVINSSGGEIESGLKMVDVLKDYPKPVDAYVLGRAYSMAAVLFESCQGSRFIVGHSKIMIHQPSALCDGRLNSSEISKLSQRAERYHKDLLEIVSERSGVSVESLEEETAAGDVYLDGSEAVERGFADKVVCFSEML